ncbi:zinc finger protein 830 [Synchiropus splendidus]|uniref:zinc finger protein 830 n=1 Tax=Synchiropus splendidus TaxID=270530 RepID=UPI00237E9953|nr:zinc finger protein 830 [Synchiropus splendidus]XP_053738635.1 zinc finger protein 830 [Synchiropus splendidus]
MAPSKKEKKAVNQEELRRLMREKQRQSSERKRVDSPFAKYSSLGLLSCSLCSVQLKSELLWPAHVLGKAHKEKVSELKEGRQEAVKRKAPDGEDVGGKKAKPPELPGDVFAKPLEPAAPQKPGGLSLLAGVYQEEEEEEEEEEEQGEASQEAEPSGLPADFFDSSIPPAPAVAHSGSIQKAAEEPSRAPGKKDNASEVLPEGFFDDPVRDAKVRNVDTPKDHMDKEWEEFQKEIRQVNTKSEAIVAEDDEEGRIERQIDEIDEQIECYKRVELLRDQRDLVKSKAPSRKVEAMEAGPATEEEEEEVDDEEELLGLLSRDWRAKGVLA